MNLKESKMKLQRLKEIRAELNKQIEALQGKIAGIDIAIETLESDDVSAMPFTTDNSSPIKKRIPLKRPVLTYLQDAKSNGLIAQEAVQRSGGKFDRASVSSLLSRLKADNVVMMINDRYFLPEYAPKHGAGISAGSTLN